MVTIVAVVFGKQLAVLVSTDVLCWDVDVDVECVCWDMEVK